MKYTLVTDGPSDSVLLPILTWSLKNLTSKPIVEQWADFRRIPRQRSKHDKLRVAVDLYPCDLLFVHRDAESQPPEWRRHEIEESIRDLNIAHVPVIPVRMTEAWLLFNESSIRFAAGNPNGKENLNLPPTRKLEELPDPKAFLYDVLAKASGLNAGRRSRFRVEERVHHIPRYIDDYSALQALPAFQALQIDIQSALAR